MSRPPAKTPRTAYRRFTNSPASGSNRDAAGAPQLCGGGDVNLSLHSLVKGVGMTEDEGDEENPKSGFSTKQQITPHPLDLHMGSRLQLRREQCGFTQKELGDRVGVTPQQIEEYENGETRIAASRLFELARILGVKVLFFFKGMPEFVNDNF